MKMAARRHKKIGTILRVRFRVHQDKMRTGTNKDAAIIVLRPRCAINGVTNRMTSTMSRLIKNEHAK